MMAYTQASPLMNWKWDIRLSKAWPIVVWDTVSDPTQYGWGGYRDALRKALEIWEVDLGLFAFVIQRDSPPTTWPSGGIVIEASDRGGDWLAYTNPVVPWDFEMNTSSGLECSAVIELSTRLTKVSSLFPRLITHEVGHVLGLAHATDARKTVMNPSAASPRPDQQDIDTLKAYYP